MLQGVGCRVQGSGFRVLGFGFWVLGFGLRVEGSGVASTQGTAERAGETTYVPTYLPT